MVLAIIYAAIIILFDHRTRIRHIITVLLLCGYQPDAFLGESRIL